MEKCLKLILRNEMEVESWNLDENNVMGIDLGVI